ncbi:50S ribosome-binding GTPase [Quadrisphaera granulorum]|uniref:50S ribosome-binding GTPase n=1 Tax=Quadrisphaera granulorum TaxID=317664 RepID=A0A316AC94_9ACTN|nr:GTPase [Quadrisphaera granulorum]PWJ47387.1 50S ribosome-binding GTPase [Quadrisphaera granulorum]SZE98834.1 50S ribosome-binding GTPase [Quadrisphaera granulorum]
MSAQTREHYDEYDHDNRQDNTHDDDGAWTPDGADALPTALDPSTPLGAALAELEYALEIGGDELDPDAAAHAHAVAERARHRLASDTGASVVALAGATGSGKSSLFNAIAGLDVATVGVRRPTTSHPTACVWGDVPDALLDWLEVPRRHRTERVSELDAGREDALTGLVLLDLPDHDSTTLSHRLQVDRLVALADLVIWVADPQKYADAALHQRYLRHLADHQDVVVVVLNQVDTLDEASAAVCEADLRRLLAADGLDRVRLLTTSARTGQGVGALRQVLTDVVQARTVARRRAEADVLAAARELLPSVSDHDPDVATAEGSPQLVDALAVSAGVPAISDAVRSSEVRAGVGRTGWPFTRWARRLRPDPLKRLHLLSSSSSSSSSRGSGEATAITALTRTSVPVPTPSQRAQVSTAVRGVVASVAEELPPRWGDAARASAGPVTDDLADALDQAVQTVPLAAPAPRWWAAVEALQLVLAACVVVGALWLGALGVIAWLQLPAPPMPRVGPSPGSGYEAWAVPLPTVLLVGGVLLGWFSAVLSRALVRRRAERLRRSARERLRAVVADVAEEQLLSSVAHVVDRHAGAREALFAAAGHLERH